LFGDSSPTPDADRFIAAYRELIFKEMQRPVEDQEMSSHLIQAMRMRPEIAFALGRKEKERNTVESIENLTRLGPLVPGVAGK